MEDLKEQKGKATGEHRWGAGQSSSDAFVSDLQRMINRNFFVEVCRIAESESRAMDFSDLISADYVLRRLSEELFAFAFLALSDREDGGHSADETPLVSGSSKGDGSERLSIARSYLSIADKESLKEDEGFGLKIPEDVVLRIPDSDERACLSKYDDVDFYEVDFNAGLRFPLQPFMKELLKRLRLSPGMATAKLNKEKLKRMLEQKDVVLVNLGKKHQGDTTSKPSSDEVTVRPPAKDRVIDKPLTLALDPSLALRPAKSVVTKEDVDEYAKLNTDVVKRALAHSLMKGLTEAMVVPNRCMHWEEGIVKLKSQLTDAMDANKTLSSTAAELIREKSLLTDELTRVGIESSVKEKELRRMTESYGKALDQLKTLSEQMEMAGACAMEEYKLSDASPADGGNDTAESADPQLVDDATN
uniref:Uncharacterized protein n=1 Tax=Fagus sylvatica TaxID=28930 RepID=A0A2N9EMA7_FAGSY